MRMRKNLRLALAAIAATGAVAGLCALGAGPALAAPRPAASAPVSKVVHPGAGQLAFRIEKVKTSSMPARARAAMKAAGLKVPAATNYIAELVNLQYGKCVDANDAGSTAGTNGDKVQLWGCFNNSSSHANQWWWPYYTTSGWTELINWQYGLCLDANSSGGFVNGAKVQLWGCFNNSSTHPNQWWNYGPTGFYSQLTNLWGGATKVLDANNAGSSGGTNGDKIQIWAYLGGSNQFWLQ
jgi:hypothetical protein